MSAPKMKKMHWALGNPVASSTPIKRFCSPAPVIEKNANSKMKNQPGYFSARPNELLKTGDQQSKSFHSNGKRCNLVIMSSDSDSDAMPAKQTTNTSLQAKQCGIVKLQPGAKEIEKKEKKFPRSRYVKNRKSADNGVVLQERATSKPNVNKVVADRSKKRKPLTSFESSSDSSVKTSGPKVNDVVADRSKKRKPLTIFESSSDGSEIDVINHDELSKHRLRSRVYAKKPDSKLKDTSASTSPSKLAKKNLSASLSSATRKLFQDDDAQNNSKNITTPVAAIPPAPPRHSVSRTLSRITQFASEKFMVEIPKSLADSFSKSLHLIQRRIDFDVIDEPEKTKEFKKENLKSPPKSKTSPVVARRLMKLAEISSDERQDTARTAGKQTKQKRKLPGAEAVRKSNRTKAAPIPFWLGKNSDCKSSLFFLQPPEKKRRVLQAHSKLPSTKNDTRQTKSQSLKVGIVKNGAKQKEKDEHRKSVSWKDDEKRLQKINNVNKMKVCFSTFDEAEFCSDGEGEENGVLHATSLQTFDVESEFIRLLPGAKTGDLVSQVHNQLYTVLENTVCLNTEGELKHFDLHTQFYVSKGVTHQLLNKSTKVSLLQQVRIQK